MVDASNRLILGDNLQVMAELLASDAGRFAMAYLDPPYNTGGSPEAYPDQRAHEEWLDFMAQRLLALRPLMAADGLVFVQIDDHEQAYLKVLMDQIYGRDRCLAHVVIKMSELSGLKMSHAQRRLPKVKEHLLIYGMGPSSCLNNLWRQKPPTALKRYLGYYRHLILNPDEPPCDWQLVSVLSYAREQGMLSGVARGSLAETEALDALKLREAHRLVYRTNNRLLAERNQPGIAEVEAPSGKRYISWDGKQMLFLKDHLQEPLSDLWSDLSTINLNKEGVGSFRYSKKPESLLRRCLELGTRPGDWVIDPFCGSGTTAAVAHKMGRQWLTIECEDHLKSHAWPRLKAVVSGDDDGGVSQDLGWQGGGEFEVIGLEPEGFTEAGLRC